MPPSARSAANTARAVSVRPEPSRPGQPDDLAGMDLDRHVAHPPADLEMVGPEQLAADLVGVAVEGGGALGPDRGEVAPEHGRDQLQLGHLGHRARRQPCGRRA